MTDEPKLPNDPIRSAALRDPWLIAAWPGVGGVAALAAGHLVRALGARSAGALPARDYFELDHVEVSHGIARPGPLPQSLFYVWRDPRGKRDLIFFLGESQPHVRGNAMCRRIIDAAIRHGVRRVVTFAALVTPRPPTEPRRVFAAVTAPELLVELRGAGIEMATAGRIGGLNGALLAVAAERSIPAMCLLGEVSQMAAGLPNPRSALVALDAFAQIGGLEVDLEPLRAQADETDARIATLMNQLRDGDGDVEPDAEAAEPAEPQLAGAAGAGPTWNDHLPQIDGATQRRIEDLFEAARRDRGAVAPLKDELDRLGLFEAYEDRFLDLFREP